MKVETPIEYMEALEWDQDDVDHAKMYLKKWDNQSEEYFFINLFKDFDEKEREHYRNCVNYWEKKLNETKSS